MAILEFTQFQFDDSRACLYVDGKEIKLRNKVANLLSYLIQHKDRVLSKEELLNELWQHGDYRENSLIQSIRELRLALGDNAKAPIYIKTYPQRGYQWLAEVSSPAESTTSAPPKSTSFSLFIKTRTSLLVLVLFLLLSVWFITYSDVDSPDESIDAVISTIPSVVVLPFINETSDTSMAWLEFGLADMVAIDLQRSNQVHITSPAMANTLLLSAELEWPALPVHIRALLNEHHIQYALFASVRFHNKHQVLDFQLISADGKTKQGSISYPSLPASVNSISQQLLHLLLPNRKNIQLSADDKASKNPLSAQALVQGMQALQKQGAINAEKFFRAAITLQPDNHWARAHLAQSEYMLGNWQKTEQLFTEISVDVLDSDRSLQAFVSYWIAELAYRRGDNDLNDKITNAIGIAENALDIKQMARIYRLNALIAWQNLNWQAHQKWLNKSQRLFIGNSELGVEADKLFYLGNPSDIGLEKDPKNDLQKNQELLLKALNFYQQLGDQNKIAASEFSIAQNYSFSLDVREKSLTHAIALYQNLQQPYELAQALIYAGFFQMQLHNGEVAGKLFEQAKEIAQKIGAKPLIKSTHFYIAFSMLDQGLDQSELGRHGKDIDKLQQAIINFNNIIANTTMDNAADIKRKGSILVFLAWANTELGYYDLALKQLQQAKTINLKYGMDTTAAYSSYSMMRIYLAQKNFQAVIELANDKITTRLQATYLARAYYETEQANKAVSVLVSFKQQFPNQWQEKDSIRLAQYQSAVLGERLDLDNEPKAHLVYCESDWSQ